MTDEQLLEWNRRGLIPGPEESESHYYERIQHCLNIKQEFDLDPSLVENYAIEVMAQPLQTTRYFYDIEPDWIPVVFGNKYLAPWHGGCAWIFQMTEKGPLAAFIQLRNTFLTSQYYLGYYNRDELIAHELAHACRMVFEEPAFEEILAYRCSKISLSRILGPIVESSLESVIFMLTVALVAVVEMVSLFYGLEGDGSLLLGLIALPMAMVAYGSWRLWFKTRQFTRCQKNLMYLIRDAQKVNSVLYRLKDSEIRAFASMTTADILAYINESKLTSLRWRVIDLAYITASKNIYRRAAENAEKTQRGESGGVSNPTPKPSANTKGLLTPPDSPLCVSSAFSAALR